MGWVALRQFMRGPTLNRTRNKGLAPAKVSEAWPENSRFQLDARSSARAFAKYLAFMALAGQVVIWGLFAAGRIAWEGALAGGLFLIFTPAVVAVNMWLLSQGVVKLTEDQLEVQTRAGKQLYRWGDIAQVRVRTLRQLGMMDRLSARISGLDEDIQLVELTLKRSLRLGVVPGKFGTNIVGVPSFISRRVRLCVSNPEGFAEAANLLLRRRT